MLSDLQLRLMQLGLRWNVTGNTMSAVLRTVGDALIDLDTLERRGDRRAEADDREQPPVEGPEIGRVPAAAWQNRFDRLRSLLCGMHGDTVELYVDFPITETEPMEPDIREVVPVHRITGRWIAMTQDDGRLQFVCPIRSRMHG